MTYEEALQEAKNIHDQRKELYGTDWTGDPEWMQLAFIKMKVRRLERFVISKPDSTYERKKDALLDLINYAAFMLSNEIDKERSQQQTTLQEHGVVR